MLSMKRIVHAMINAEFSDGLGLMMSHGEMAYLDAPGTLRTALEKARACIEFLPCSDVSQFKIQDIDEHEPFSTRREIARACKQLLSMKVPHGQSHWGVSITPSIERMLMNKTHLLIDCIHKEADRAAYYYKQAKFVEVEFTRYVGHLVSVAIQLLPSTKGELIRIYNEIWLKRERDRYFPSNQSQKQKDIFHQKCLKLIHELESDDPPLSISSLTTLEPSGLAAIQRIHWEASFLRYGKITSAAQQAAFRAFVNLKTMAEGRNSDESKYLNETILEIVEDVELSNYWLRLLNDEIQTYQQLTCLDWSRLEGVSTRKVSRLVEVTSEYVKASNEVHLRMGLLRLLLPLVESWVLCILLERKLKKASITRHISAGLKELKEHVEYTQPDLLDTFDQLKQFARPYGKGSNNG
ncbi:hypothetical protein [Leucothrix pacifica]|uniref:Uncharacterized protein n=1 Tax=Leucothrix pacifica TaxID=1247513 RepID=A0A317CP80_9GAMM|nr:hypothetical protein [Leucothrix pacifica]PWQ98142.1 hypothetical protein DKW60_08490 [Leucothrix pacifica]